MKNETDCRYAETLMPQYIEGKLDPAGTKLLIRHIKGCHECYDELEIRFLISEGLKRVESGETMDLKNELENRVSRSAMMIAMIERIQTGIYIIEGTAIFVMGACLLMLLL